MSLHLVRVYIDGGRLFQRGARRRLPLRDADEGYLAHCALVDLFGNLAPRPFAVQEAEGHWLTVLGYTAADAPTLRDHASAFADPEAWSTCDWGRLASKPMPEAWALGTRLAFSLRACPVQRVSGNTGVWRSGAEVDVFLLRCHERQGEPVARSAVYQEWLDAEFQRRGGARLVSFDMKAFARRRVLRRTQGDDRVARTPERPDARFAGHIEVTDCTAFERLLARGIGRHRAFGFGMMLLAPPGA